MVDDVHQHGQQHATSVPPQSARANTTTNLVELQAIEVGLPSSDLHSNTTTNSLHIISGGDLLNVSSELQAPYRAPLSTIFRASKETLAKSPLMISQEKFHWDQVEQGHIMGAFFYGYILFQIPGARMAESIGARWILMTSTAGSALISLIFPLSTQLNSVYLLMLLRFVMGLCQSAFFPAAYVFFCRWLPESERSILLPIMFIGSNMGSVSTYIMSSYLISSSYGWPSVFYVSGLICLLALVLWCIFGSNGPHDNWLITDRERKYILTNINNTPLAQVSHKRTPLELVQAKVQTINNNHLNNVKHSNFSKHIVPEVLPTPTTTTSTKFNKSKSANDLIPNQVLCVSNVIDMTQNKKQRSVFFDEDLSYCSESRTFKTQGNGSQRQPDISYYKLLKSVPVWVLVFSMYGNEWSQVVLMYELPTYLNAVLNFPIEQNGAINSFFQLSFTLASPLISTLATYMLDNHLFGMQKIHIRKLFQSLATFGQLICYISIPICGANRGLIIMFMFWVIICKACSNAGDIMVSGDLSPEYAGTIFACANSIGNTAGFCVPELAGFFVKDSRQREQWTPFWLISGAIMGCSGLIFLIFGETDRQNYAKDEPKVDQLRPHHSTRGVVKE